jgi:hypothetical protein
MNHDEIARGNALGGCGSDLSRNEKIEFGGRPMQTPDTLANGTPERRAVSSRRI